VKGRIEKARLEIDTRRAPNFADFTLSADGQVILAGRSVVEPRLVGNLKITSKPGLGKSSNECFDAHQMETHIADASGKELAVVKANRSAIASGYLITVWSCESRTNVRCQDIPERACYVLMERRKGAGSVR
jgi:hypothetical protein